jgi:uncharacterized protein
MILNSILLAAAGFIAWLISTVSAGGGGLLLIPVISFLIGSQAVAPVVTMTTLFGGPSRVYLFWKYIRWEIVAWYLPGAIAGAFIGAYIFTRTEAGWLQVILGLFLISTIFQFRFGEKVSSFNMKRWYFLPIAFIVSLISGITGEAGPVLNPFYLNYGAIKEEMIGTKSVNSLAMQLTKIGTYTAFGAMSTTLLWYGVAVGISAALASWVGKLALQRMEGEWFRRMVITVMVISGLLMLWEQRELFGL